MKNVVAILVLACLAMACHKRVGERENVDKQLFGKWKYTEQYLSAGAEGSWRPAEPAGQVVEFKKNGKLESSGDIFKTYSRYKFVDSARIQLSPIPGDGKSSEMFISITQGNQLTLAPFGCIEGCMMKFTRE